MAFVSLVLRFTALFLLFLCPSSTSASRAWNGHTTPGSIRKANFRPYYVPPGAKSYDSSSPLVLYSGKWSETYSASYVGGSVHRTSDHGAAVTFKFSGTGIEVFGNTGTNYGKVKVYVDGKPDRVVDLAISASSRLRLHGQRYYWNYLLSPGQHTIKIVSLASSAHRIIDLDAFIVTSSSPAKRLDAPSNDPLKSFLNLATREQARVSSEPWKLAQKGSTGVHAMQLSIISDTHAIIVDKVEHNPVTVNGHPAWAALFNLETYGVKPLDIQSNSFCAGGSWLRDGTLINVGGNPVVADYTSAADFGDLNGLQAIRTLPPCDSPNTDHCEMHEDHSQVRLASPRWYNTVVRIPDGSAMIIGGSKKGGWINNSTVNNPTIEYYPSKSIHGSNGLPIQLPFLIDTLNSNLFPHAFVLPDGKIFLAANRDATIYDWKKNTERRLPQLPNGIRVTYPMSGVAILLPLSPENNYTPEVLVCGGSTLDDTRPSWEISSQDPASSQCSRMVLTDEGINRGWEIEQMPEARTMADAILLPTGQVVIVNGARTGISGYGNVRDQVGASNADHPVLSPVLYDPTSPIGQRFSSKGMPTSLIPRLYHSVATLTPMGDVMIAGSNPNLDRSSVKYGTEYRVEWLSPPYMEQERPKIVDYGDKLEFGKLMKIKVQGLSGTGNIQVVLMDLGYVTHAVHMNSRMVYLVHQVDDENVTIIGPPDGNIYPPGPGWLYVLRDGVPSKGVKLMIGDGKEPPRDEKATKNMLKKTTIDKVKAGGEE